MMVLLLVNVINDGSGSLSQLPPKILPKKQPQNLQSVRILQQSSVRRTGEVRIEMGEVGEELVILQVTLFHQNYGISKLLIIFFKIILTFITV